MCYSNWRKWLTDTEAWWCRGWTKRATKRKKKKRVNFADATKEEKESGEINAPPPNKDTKKAKRKFLFLSALLGLLGYGRERPTKNHATSSPDGGQLLSVFLLRSKTRSQWMTFGLLRPHLAHRGLRKPERHVIICNWGHWVQFRGQM